MVSEALNLNTNSYEYDFHSGSTISCYIGDILVDDIKHIQFSVTQTKRPIYGYASQYYHKAAPGQVLVEGMFTIDFKEADYILATLARYQDKMAPINVTGGPSPSGKSETTYLVSRDNIERAIAREAEGQEPVGNLYEFYRDLAALPDTEFEKVAEAFEDKLWQQPGNDFFTGSVPAGTENPGDTFRRGDQYGSFDIYILYGDIANAAANHTIKKIIDIDIVGQGQVITEGGQSVEETYRFMARNVA